MADQNSAHVALPPMNLAEPEAAAALLAPQAPPGPQGIHPQGQPQGSLQPQVPVLFQDGAPATAGRGQPVINQILNPPQVAEHLPPGLPALAAAHLGGVPGTPGVIPTDATIRAPQGNIPNIRHTNFASLYHDTSKDPLRNRYEAVIDHFDAMAANPQTPEGLLELTLGNPSVPITFLCCAALPGTGRPKVYLLHMLSKFTPSLDG
jgi:hypothetical protein